MQKRRKVQTVFDKKLKHNMKDGKSTRKYTRMYSVLSVFCPLLIVKGGLASLPQRKCLKPGPFQDDDCRAIWMNDGLVGGGGGEIP